MPAFPAARQGDAVTCPRCGTTAIAAGSPNVIIEGLPAATLGHACGCGAPISAAVIPNVFINGQPVAVTGSVTAHGGVVIGGAGTVIIGNQVISASPSAASSAAVAPVVATAPTAAPTALRDAPATKTAPSSLRNGSVTTQPDSAAPQEVTQRITLRIGVFFDGTGNNAANSATGSLCGAQAQGYSSAQAQSLAQHCKAYMSDPASSYGNVESNVWRLMQLYRDDTQRALPKSAKRAAIPVYVEGIGTRSGEADSLIGMGTGTGDFGVMACVGAFPNAFSRRYDEWSMLNPQVVVEAIEFDIFGFSRGAAAARHFANETLKPHGGIAANGLQRCFTWQSDRVALNFIGLFDTVAAVADVLRGDFTPADAVNPGVNLYLPPGCARQVVQLRAAHEQRLNFALNSVAPDHREILLPGVHSDIGGGYPDWMTEDLLVTRTRVSEVAYGTPTEMTDSYRQAVADRQRLAQEAWFDPGKDELTVDTWRRSLSQATDTTGTPYREVFAAVRVRRSVSGALSRIYLRIMHRLALANDVPFRDVPETINFTVPSDLGVISEKLLAYAQGADWTLSDAELQLLLRQYIHKSANWNASFGENGSPLDVVFVNRPAPGGQRAIYPNRPQPGYPQ